MSWILPGKRPRKLRLSFAPLAWLKLQYFCHAGDTEIGGFGVSSPHNLLHVQDFVTVRQTVTAVSVRFDDAAVGDYVDRSVDAGIPLPCCARIWCHTHPGASPKPSPTDEETFARCFGKCDWSIMFIVGRTGKTYARLAFNVGPGAAVTVKTRVSWSRWPEIVEDRSATWDRLREQWQEEYKANIEREVLGPPFPAAVSAAGWDGSDWFLPNVRHQEEPFVDPFT